MSSRDYGWCAIYKYITFDLTCAVRQGLRCCGISLLSTWCMEKPKCSDDTLTLPVFAMMCFLMCALNWLTGLYGLLCGRHQSILLGLRFPGRKGGEGPRKGRERRSETKKEWEKGEILIRWRARWVPCLPDLPNCWHHRCSTPLMFIPRLLSSCPPHFNCPFVSAPCGFVCERVRVCVSVCMHARAADKA